MRTAKLLGGSVITALLISAVTGCVSAQDSAAPVTGTPAPSTAPDRSPECPLLTSAALTEITGIPFQPQPSVPESDDNAIACQWTATDAEALVITRTITQDPEFTFRQSRLNTERNLGPAVPTTVTGARAAFAVPSQNRVAMVVEDEFIEVTVLVPSATPVQQAEIVQLAARRAS